MERVRSIALTPLPQRCGRGAELLYFGTRHQPSALVKPNPPARGANSPRRVGERLSPAQADVIEVNDTAGLLGVTHNLGDRCEVYMSLQGGEVYRQRVGAGSKGYAPYPMAPAVRI